MSEHSKVRTTVVRLELVLDAQGLPALKDSRGTILTNYYASISHDPKREAILTITRNYKEPDYSEE